MLLAVLYVLVIFAVSSIPSLRTPGPEFISKDKIAHIVEYSVLGALVFRAVGWRVSRSRAAAFLFVFALCASVAAADELYQSFIPGRSMSALDWAADALGAAVGAGVFAFTGLGAKPPQGRAQGPSGARQGGTA